MASPLRVAQQIRELAARGELPGEPVWDESGYFAGYRNHNPELDAQIEAIAAGPVVARLAHESTDTDHPRPYLEAYGRLDQLVEEITAPGLVLINSRWRRPGRNWRPNSTQYAQSRNRAPDAGPVQDAAHAARIKASLAGGLSIPRTAKLHRIGIWTARMIAKGKRWAEVQPAGGETQ